MTDKEHVIREVRRTATVNSGISPSGRAVMWEEAKQRFPIGRRVRGVVTRHCPFGIFVDLGDPIATGLVQITEFRDEVRMTPEQYPPLGAEIEAIVLGHTDEGRKQVWLSVKPSQLNQPV